MQLIFKSDDREFKAEVNSFEDIYQAVRDGMVAMSYHIDTANAMKEELENPDEEI